MKYTHLSRDERYQIAALVLRGDTPTQIAVQLKRNKSTISREIKRNGSAVFSCYRAHMACERAALRAPNSRNAKPVCASQLARALDAVRTEQWSPEQSAAKSGISHETLYRHIYADKAQGGDLWTHLRRKRRVRRSRAQGMNAGDGYRISAPLVRAQRTSKHAPESGISSSIRLSVVSARGLL
jgi:transposase, IS30 family